MLHISQKKAYTLRIFLVFASVIAICTACQFADRNTPLALANPAKDQYIITSHTPLEPDNTYTILQTYENLPLTLIEADREVIENLKKDSNITHITQNFALEPAKTEIIDTTQSQNTEDMQSIKNQADDRYRQALFTLGGDIDDDNNLYYTDRNYRYDGSSADQSYEIAILDSGVDPYHEAMQGKIVHEACFSYSNHAAVPAIDISSVCPSGNDSDRGVVGSGIDCTLAPISATDCGHGTMVAGASVTDYALLNNDVITSGTAPKAKVIPIQINAQYTISDQYKDQTGNPCGAGVATCTKPFISSIYSALDYLITLKQSRPNLIAANISSGGGAYLDHASCKSAYSSHYDNFSYAINTLKNLGVATIVSTGNQGSMSSNYNKIAFPACVEGAIAVGATNMLGTSITSYSQNGDLTTLLAPGGEYTSATDLFWTPKSVPGSTNIYAGVTGTSFSTPAIAGVYTILKAKYPAASIDQITTILQSFSTQITDTRTGYNNLPKPLPNLKAALVDRTPLGSLTHNIEYDLQNNILIGIPEHATLDILNPLYQTTYTPHDNGNQFYTGQAITFSSNPTIGNTVIFSPTIIIRGDINGDGNITQSDLLRVFRHLNASDNDEYILENEAYRAATNQGASSPTQAMLLKIFRHINGVKTL